MDSRARAAANLRDETLAARTRPHRDRATTTRLALLAWLLPLSGARVMDGGPRITLNDGRTMPQVGLGTWKSEPGAVKAAVKAAVKCGYRHIDCAAIYKNEHEVGEALAELFSEGIVRREDLWITSKLWNDFHAADAVAGACEKTLRDLQLDFLDLYLIHWPVATNSTGPTLDPTIEETWTAMEALCASGKARSIGVSNFSGMLHLASPCLHARLAFPDTSCGHCSQQRSWPR